MTRLLLSEHLMLFLNPVSSRTDILQSSEKCRMAYQSLGADANKIMYALSLIDLCLPHYLPVRADAPAKQTTMT